MAATPPKVRERFIHQARAPGPKMAGRFVAHAPRGYNPAMIAVYEDLTPEALAPLGFDSPAQACRLLQEMAGHNIPDVLFNTVLQALMTALSESADPDRAVANLVRWGEAVGSRAAAYQFLATAPQAARILVTVLAASQFFADLLIRDPEYLEALTNSSLRAHTRSAAAIWSDLRRRVEIARTPNARRDALRRAKGLEVLRIGVRDLLGDAEMPVIVQEISDLADSCVRMALQICREERGGPRAFSVIAMGKLGGRELNYSSDIDLIFVHGDEEDSLECVRLAKSVGETLAKVTPSGYLFRVDLRLRPEGRFGPVSRSLSSCRAYYESWAEPWERQALLKARAVAGDESLGTAFVAMTQAFAYQNRIEEAFVESIRQNKRRLEEKVARAGEAETNVKEGRGGIRDIEFPIQLMLLLAGGSHPAIRTGNTLEAIDRLTGIGMLTAEERMSLRIRISSSGPWNTGCSCWMTGQCAASLRRKGRSGNSGAFSGIPMINRLPLTIFGTRGGHIACSSAFSIGITLKKRPYRKANRYGFGCLRRVTRQRRGHYAKR